MKLAVHLAEEIVNRLLNIGSRLRFPNDCLMAMLRPDIAFGYAGSKQRRPDRYQSDDEANAAFIPSGEPTKPEFQP